MWLECPLSTSPKIVPKLVGILFGVQTYTGMLGANYSNTIGSKTVLKPLGGSMEEFLQRIMVRPEVATREQEARLDEHFTLNNQKEVKMDAPMPQRKEALSSQDAEYLPSRERPEASSSVTGYSPLGEIPGTEADAFEDLPSGTTSRINVEEEDVEMKGETLPVEFHRLRRLGTDQDRLDEVTEEEMLRANRAVSFRLFEQLAEECSEDDQPPIGP